MVKKSHVTKLPGKHCGVYKVSEWGLPSLAARSLRYVIRPTFDTSSMLPVNDNYSVIVMFISPRSNTIFCLSSRQTKPFYTPAPVKTWSLFLLIYSIPGISIMNFYRIHIIRTCTIGTQWSCTFWAPQAKILCIFYTCWHFCLDSD